MTKASLIRPDQLKEALKLQKETGGKLGETLIKLGFVSEEDITECLSQQFGVPSINLAHFEIDGGVIKLIPADVARKYNILPVNKTGATITIAMADPTNVFAMDDIKNPPLKLKDAITSRLKILAKLDISEKRLPQDGRIKLKMKLNEKNKELDFRVSILPTLFGEKIVMRLLDKENLRLDMTKLGFESESLVKFEKAILKPYGMVLVTGPTGSGKTNTLYSSIARLNTPDTNIMTAEDPVEFQLAGVNQVQMKEQIGLNFAAALRAFWPQDPNIILVGEIRDFETAEIAIKAALTGHIVLSTLHTNDAPCTSSRLMNRGTEPFLVATSVNLIGAHRDV